MKEYCNSRFDSISPSAKALLLTKTLINIPFAKEAVKCIYGTNNELNRPEKLSSSLLLRLMHFEDRYLSLDKGLAELGIKNILEFSSGFSFRGLSFCKDSSLSYIDTDLPKIIEHKRIIV